MRRFQMLLAGKTGHPAMVGPPLPLAVGDGDDCAVTVRVGVTVGVAVLVGVEVRGKRVAVEVNTAVGRRRLWFGRYGLDHAPKGA